MLAKSSYRGRDLCELIDQGLAQRYFISDYRGRINETGSSRNGTKTWYTKLFVVMDFLYTGCSVLCRGQTNGPSRVEGWALHYVLVGEPCSVPSVLGEVNS